MDIGVFSNYVGVYTGLQGPAGYETAKLCFYENAVVALPVVSFQTRTDILLNYYTINKNQNNPYRVR